MKQTKKKILFGEYISGVGLKKALSLKATG